MYKREVSIQLTRVLLGFSFSSLICDEMSKSYHYFGDINCGGDFGLSCIMYQRSGGAYHHGKGVVKGATQILFKKWHIITMGATQVLLKNGTVTILFEKFTSAI
jgi:hypothetical protein